MVEITYEEMKDLTIMIDYVIRDYNKLMKDMEVLNDCLTPIMLKLPKEESNVEHE